MARRLWTVSATAISVALASVPQAAADDWLTDDITGCEVWSAEPAAGEESVSWTGACAEGKASGEGVLVW